MLSAVEGVQYMALILKGLGIQNFLTEVKDLNVRAKM